jgi:Spy/CpxP family protein refolding chaperone
MKKLFLNLTLTALFAISMIGIPAFAQDNTQPCPLNQGPGMGPPAEAGQGQFRKGMHKGQGEMRGGMMGMFKKLNLTEEQKTKLKAQRESAKTQIQSLRPQMKTEREKLMDQMFDPNVSKQQLLTQADKVANLQSKLHKIRIENMADLKTILTPEQKQILQQEAIKRKEKMKSRRGMMKDRLQKRFNNNDTSEKMPPEGMEM